MIEKTCRACGHTAMVESAMAACPGCGRVYLKTEVAYDKKINAAREQAAQREPRKPSRQRQPPGRSQPGGAIWMVRQMLTGRYWRKPPPQTPLSMADLTFGRVFFLTLKFFIAWTVISWVFKLVMLTLALGSVGSMLVGMDLE